MTTGESEASEYWMDRFGYDYTNTSNYSITSFGPQDIEPEKKRTFEEIKNIASNNYGKHSKNANDNKFLEEVQKEHEIVRKRVFSEAGPLVTSFYCSLASISGLSTTDGGNFVFRHIPNDLISHWNLKSLVRYFFIIRAGWDDNPNWILLAEKKILEQVCYEYKDGFTSSLKNMGFVGRIVAITRSRRLRELNNLLAKKTGYRMTVVNISDKKGRRIPCLLQVDTMLTPDTTMKRIISEDHNKEDIIRECNELNGEINLLHNKLNHLPHDAFFQSRQLFTSERHDYSNLISRVESHDKMNEILESHDKTNESIESQEETNDVFDTTVLDQLFNKGNHYSGNMEEKSNEIQEFDVPLKTCNSKRKKLKTISGKNKKQKTILSDSDDTDYHEETDDEIISFEPAQRIEINKKEVKVMEDKKAVKVMEEFKKNIEREQHLLLEKAQAEKIKKVF